jgi:hypothetical protein
VRSVFLVVWLLLASTLACGRQQSEVQGVLIEVQSSEIVNAEAITLRAADGTIHTFRVSPEVAANREHPTTASHLRQHMAVADPVIVRYRETPEGWVALQIVDAGRTP